MKRGVLLFAHNNDSTNYYDMAVYTASRIKKFLNLPITIVTDEYSNTENKIFDNIIIVEPNKNNKRDKSIWINKNRYSAYTLSPYDDTLVIDVDYMINSDQLLNLFSLSSDFLCHYNVKFLLDDIYTERISSRSFNTYWATVMKFKKTQRVKHIFYLIEMIQNNYSHYSTMYDFLGTTYRNDYALTIALRTVCGQITDLNDNIPWKLIHIPQNANLIRISDTSYKVLTTIKDKVSYIEIKDIDFHVLNKNSFKKLI